MQVVIAAAQEVSCCQAWYREGKTKNCRLITGYVSAQGNNSQHHEMMIKNDVFRLRPW